MTDMNMDRLAGKLAVRPGVPRPHNLVSSRPHWIDQITRGQPAHAVAARLASLFNLCGQSHHLCAELALEAARGRPGPPSDLARQQLQIETLREHLRRIGLDWPLQLASDPETGATIQARSLRALAACPMPWQASTHPQAPVQGVADWLARECLGLPAAQWLAQWDADPQAWLTTWSAQTPGWLPELLQACKTAADVAMAGAPALRVHTSEPELRALAGALLAAPANARQPQWREQCAETGTWTRLHLEHTQRLDSPWLRLGARLAEAIRLAQPEAAQHSGTQWLQAASLCVAPNEGLAWVEMARGLLIHHVRLSDSSAKARVEAYHVIAPTEWNFHPRGAVAQALETLPPYAAPGVNRSILMLMTAFDPCVRFDIQHAMPSTEAQHA